MKTLTRISLFALFLVLAFAAATRVASAQCAAIRFGNNTHCDVNICIRTTGGVFCSGTLVPSGDGPGFPPLGSTIVGVVSAGGISYPFVSGPMPTTFWVQNVTLGPSGCCVDVIFDPATCTIKAVPPSVPGPCNP